MLLFDRLRVCLHSLSGPAQFHPAAHGPVPHAPSHVLSPHVLSPHVTPPFTRRTLSPPATSSSSSATTLTLATRHARFGPAPHCTWHHYDPHAPTRDLAHVLAYAISTTAASSIIPSPASAFVSLSTGTGTTNEPMHPIPGPMTPARAPRSILRVRRVSPVEAALAAAAHVIHTTPLRAPSPGPAVSPTVSSAVPPAVLSAVSSTADYLAGESEALRAFVPVPVSTHVDDTCVLCPPSLLLDPLPTVKPLNHFRLERGERGRGVCALCLPIESLLSLFRVTVL